MITSPLPPLDPPPQDPSPDTPLASHDTNPRGDETESESEPQLSRSSLRTSSTFETPLPTPVDDHALESRQWMLSAACEEEVKEWGQYLGEAAVVSHRLSTSTAASSSVWSSVARSHLEFDP